MNSPLLSICIPTFNRSQLLEESLSSMVNQLTNKDLRSSIEIIISDNHSQDNTPNVVSVYRKKFRSIKYNKNDRNIGIINTIKVAEKATGKYIWFFSDDDWQKKNSINKIIDLLRKYQPDLILANLDLYSKNGKVNLDANLLRSRNNNFIGSKKAFFKHLENKFFLPIDWYMTSYSNTIISSSLFRAHLKKAYQYFAKGCLFPHTTFFYYTELDYKVVVTKESLIRFRADNRSFGSREKNKFLISWYSTLRQHYSHIYSFNRKYLTYKFIFLLLVKELTRSLRLKFLLLFGVDISDFLIKYFYKKN